MNRWISGRKGWRTLWIKTAAVNAFCLAIAFVVAMEFYLDAAGGPMKVSWWRAAEGSLRHWLPWMLMSPLIVGLAEVFRFDMKKWRRNLLVHLAACLAFATVDESLLTLMLPASRGPFFGGPFAGMRGGVPGGAEADWEKHPAPPMMAGPGPFETTPRPPSQSSPFGPDGFPPRGENQSNDMAPMPAHDGGSQPPLRNEARGPMFAPGNASWRDALHRSMFAIQFAAPVYWWMVCGCWAWSYFQESRERERRALELETRLTQASLQALKMQLQPHFLFNALNALIHENPKAADDMLAALSQFLRMCLDASSQNEVPLRKELEFADRYLEIQQTRFGDRLRVQRKIDPAAADAIVPPLLLQPLVENAIRHGIETRESGGLVTIHVQRHGDMLRLEVCDDGPGFTGRDWPAIGEGIGLSNTKARLQALYGDRHLFRLMANSPAGTLARVEIPFRTMETRPSLES